MSTILTIHDGVADDAYHLDPQGVGFSEDPPTNPEDDYPKPTGWVRDGDGPSPGDRAADGEAAVAD